jgi:hypothetical protein
MDQTLPTGRAATAAWRQLGPQIRAQVWTASTHGQPLPDVTVGVIAAGYGKTMERRITVTLLASLAVFVFGAVFGTVGLVLAGVDADTITRVLLPLYLVVYAGYAIFMRVQRVRYRRLHSIGLLTVEAAQVDPSRAQHAALVTSDESGFTVPYGFQAAAHAPAAVAAPATLAPDGSYVVPIRRTAILRGLLVYAILFFLGVIEIALTRTVSPLLLPLFVLLVVLAGGMIVLNLVMSGRYLIDPVVARFTPAGWEFTASGMHGSWQDVRRIRVSPPRGRRRTATGLLGATRVVLLDTADPAANLAQATGMRRALGRRAMQRYGSPIGILANPRTTVGVVELVQVLQRYTAAPITWG